MSNDMDLLYNCLIFGESVLIIQRWYICNIFRSWTHPFLFSLFCTSFWIWLTEKQNRFLLSTRGSDCLHNLLPLWAAPPTCSFASSQHQTCLVLLSSWYYLWSGWWGPRDRWSQGRQQKQRMDGWMNVEER